MRVIKIALVLLVVINLVVFGFAYVYQYIWPKKRILICSPGNESLSDAGMVRTLADPGVPFPGRTTIQLPGSFHATKDIRTFFAKQGLPSESKEVEGNSEEYFFLLAYPYSGMDGADLYCFVRRTNGWVHFLKASLANMNRGPVAFKPNDQNINVVQAGEIIMTIKQPAK